MLLLTYLALFSWALWEHQSWQNKSHMSINIIKIVWSHAVSPRQSLSLIGNILVTINTYPLRVLNEYWLITLKSILKSRWSGTLYLQLQNTHKAHTRTHSHRTSTNNAPQHTNSYTLTLYKYKFLRNKKSNSICRYDQRKWNEQWPCTHPQVVNMPQWTHSCHRFQQIPDIADNTVHSGKQTKCPIQII